MVDNTQLKYEKAIAALLTEPTIQLAAEKIGIGETTLYRWMKDEAFNKSFKETRKNALSQTISRLQQTSTDAVNTLKSVMTNEEATASSRVTAARTVLEMAFKAYELEDLATRLEEMEQHIQELKGGGDHAKK
jgi:hypothetical protein